MFGCGTVGPDTGRRLHVLDIENMQGSCDGHVTEGEVARTVPATDSDQVVIGTSHPKNLLDVLDGENIAARFSSVVLGSGDHIFAPSARRFRALGCNVLLLDTGTPISRLLRGVANGIVHVTRTLTPAVAGGLAAAI